MKHLPDQHAALEMARLSQNREFVHMKYLPDGISLQTALVSLFAVVTILAVGLVGVLSHSCRNDVINRQMPKAWYDHEQT